MGQRVAIYLRVSTVGQSCDLQRSEIESYLRTRGWLAWRFYEDKQTGTNGNRPALKQMMTDARARKLDFIVVWKLDRMYRSLKDLVTTLQELEELKVTFISLKDSIYMTSASGRLMTHLLAAFAEFEATLIKERVIAGLANAKRKGIRLGRPQIVNADDVRLLHASGLSLGQIAKRLSISKSAVHKTIRRMPCTNSVINPETIDSWARVSAVQQTKDLSTINV